MYLFIYSFLFLFFVYTGKVSKYDIAKKTYNEVFLCVCAGKVNNYGLGKKTHDDKNLFKLEKSLIMADLIFP